ncbi:hypothetical protein D3C80_1475910 [compost metagenome]
MAHGIHPRSGNGGADTDAGEVVLFPIDDLAFAGHRFQCGDVLLDAVGSVADAGVSGEPEAFAWPVIGEDDGLGGIEAAFGRNGTHVAGGSYGARRAGADCLGQAELQLHIVEVLIPHGEPAGGEGVGPRVETLQRGVGTAHHGDG